MRTPIPCQPTTRDYEVVKAALKAKKHNQKWLAEKIKYSATTVNAYLNGRMPLASNQIVTIKILKALGLTLDDLHGTGKPRKK